MIFLTEDQVPPWKEGPVLRERGSLEAESHQTRDMSKLFPSATHVISQFLRTMVNVLREMKTFTPVTLVVTISNPLSSLSFKVSSKLPVHSGANPPPSSSSTISSTYHTGHEQMICISYIYLLWSYSFTSVHNALKK